MTESEDYYRGWNAAYADEGWDENASDEWKAGYSEARDALADEAEHAAITYAECGPHARTMQPDGWWNP